MPIVRVTVTRSGSGAWVARKGIPKDVRERYVRLYGQGWEAKTTFDATLSFHQAKAKAAEFYAEIENRIGAIRAAQRGEGIELSQKQALALAGEWYRWFIAPHEDNPGTVERWRENFWLLVDHAQDHHPGGLEATQGPSPLATIQRDPPRTSERCLAKKVHETRYRSSTIGRLLRKTPR